MIRGNFSDQPSKIKNSCLLSVFLKSKTEKSEAAKPHSLVGRRSEMLVQMLTLTRVSL